MIDELKNSRNAAGWISAELRRRITSGEYSPGSAIPTVRALGLEFGVSYQTAYRATRNLAAAGLLRNIQGRGTFVEGGRQPKRRKGPEIGIVFDVGQPDSVILGAAFEPFWKYSSAELERQGISIAALSARIAENPDTLRRCLDRLSGLITNYNFIRRPGVERFLEHWKRPVILVSHDSEMPCNFHQVIAEPSTGLREAYRRMRSRGHEECILIGGAANSDRLNAACAIAAECSIQIRHEFAESGSTTTIGYPRGRILTRNILSQFPQTRAILCISDFFAFGVYDELQSCGITPGNEIDLLSYDDLESDGYLPENEPVLTSIAKPRREAGIEAAKLCSQALTDDKVVRISKILTHLVVRRSG